MKLTEQRRIAIQAARGYLRKMGIDPMTVDVEGAEEALSDLLSQDSTLVASIWYAKASEKQWRLFRKEWAGMKRAERFEGDEELVTVAMEITTFTSYDSFADAFHKAFEFLKADKKRADLLEWTKTDRAADIGYQVILYLRRGGFAQKVS